jgi:hypothetical protein
LVALFSGKIKKRDGIIVDFDSNRVKDAVYKAFLVVELSDGEKAGKVTREAVKILQDKFSSPKIRHAFFI